MKSGNLVIAILLVAIAAVGLFWMASFAPGSADRLGLGGPAVGIVQIRGPIDDADQFQHELDTFGRQGRIKALVVRIDSPGGGVAASQEIHACLTRYREETGRPVVASMGGVAASGGYYVACATDRIVANPGTLTGSIGVILTFANAEGLLSRIGLRFQSIKSGPMKDEGAFWRDLTEEERKVLQSMVDDVYEQFVDAVEEGRRIPREEILALADGRVLSGRQAFEAGLVDTLGDLSLAVDEARNLAGLRKSAPVLRPPRAREGLLSWLERSSSKLPALVEPGIRLEYRLGLPSGGGVVGSATR